MIFMIKHLKCINLQNNYHDVYNMMIEYHSNTDVLNTFIG